jgi:hypothetical protein
MITIILLALGLVIFWIIKDQITAKNELNSDPSFKLGIKNKFPLSFKDLYLRGFNIINEKKSEVVLQKIILEQNLFCEIHITYLAGKKIQILIQTNKISPKNHLSTKTFQCPSSIGDEPFKKNISLSLLNFDLFISNYDPWRILER